MIGRIELHYYSELKDEYKKGKIPLKNDFYGQPLRKEIVTLDHLVPVSKKGKNTLSNYVLATEFMNNQRGNKDIFLYTTEENIEEYFKIFENCKIGKTEGVDYIKMISKTLRKLWRESEIYKNREMWSILDKWK